MSCPALLVTVGVCERHYTKNLYLYNLSITDNTTQPGLEGGGGKTSDWSVIGNVIL